MDIISVECAQKHYLFFRDFFFKYRNQGVNCQKSYVFNHNGSGFELQDYDILYSFIQIMAPNWEELRVCLKQTNPSIKTMAEFEAISSIDEYADKLVEHITEWGNTDK